MELVGADGSFAGLLPFSKHASFLSNFFNFEFKRQNHPSIIQMNKNIETAAEAMIIPARMEESIFFLRFSKVFQTL